MLSQNGWMLACYLKVKRCQKKNQPSLYEKTVNLSIFDLPNWLGTRIPGSKDTDSQHKYVGRLVVVVA